MKPCARSNSANETRVVLQTHDMLVALLGEEKRADGSECLDHAAVHASMDDSVSLQVLWAHSQLSPHLIFGGQSDVHPHRFGPALRPLFEMRREVLAHE
jgi:hypothetical protein